jgi:predicted protein tyrosine phosphatase
VGGSARDGYDIFLSVIAEPLNLPGNRCVSVRSEATSLLAVTADGGPPGAIVVTGEGPAVELAAALCDGTRADELRQLHQLGIPIVAVGSVVEAFGSVVVAKTVASMYMEEPLWVASTYGETAIQRAVAEGYLSTSSSLDAVPGVGLIPDTLVVGGRQGVALGRPVGAQSSLSQLATDANGAIVARSIGIPAERGAVYYGNDGSIAPVRCSTRSELLVCTVVEVGAGSHACLDVVPLIDHSLVFPDNDARDLMHWGSPESFTVSWPTLRLRAAELSHRDTAERRAASTQSSSSGTDPTQVKALELLLGDPSDVIPSFLLVGSASAAARFGTLGVTHVVNCAVDVPSYPAYFLDSTVRVLQLDLEDSVDEDMDNFVRQLRRATAFIAEASATPGARVLVHCRAGVSRASSVAIYYLMERKQLSMAEALSRVKAARPIIRPNEAYLNMLRTLDRWGDPRDARRTEVSSIRPAPAASRQATSSSTSTSTSSSMSLSSRSRATTQPHGAPSKFTKKAKPPKVEEEEDEY